jgi:hypothetical protein
MVARSKIVDINRSVVEVEPEQAEEAPETAALIARSYDDRDQHVEAEMAEAAAEEYSTWDEEEAVSTRNWPAILTLSALFLAAAGWTGFFVWANLATIAARPAPLKIIELIGTWSVPMALLALLWLLSMRHSSREAKRFGDVAHLLRNESEALERTMRTVNGEIALARSFLAENARELDTVGKMSAQRLTSAAEQLGAALSDSDERAKVLETVSNAAVSNVEQLRNHLPVVTSAAKDATNQIGIAGNTAHGQVQAILTALRHVDETAVAVGTTMKALDSQITETSGRMENQILGSSASLATSVERSEQRTAKLIAALDGAIGQSESRLDKMANAVEARIHASQAQLGANLERLSSSIEQVAATASEHDEAISAYVERINASVADCRGQLSGISDDATDRISKLAFAVSALSESSSDLHIQVVANGEQTSGLIDQTDKLRATIAELSSDTSTMLPSHIEALDQSIARSRAAFAEISGEISAADEGSKTLLSQLAALEKLVTEQNGAIDALLTGSNELIGSQQQQVDALSSSLDHTRSMLSEMSGIANDQLVASMLRVRETTQAAADSSRQIIDEELSGVAARLTEQNKAALASAVDEQVAALDTAMRVAMDRNLSVAGGVETRIRTQMETLDHMAANLEQRISTAHASFGGLDDEGFARRMALLTESLNSAAIDVAKILSNEVTDTAWAAYLKGDRGVFTRRAVRLLDSGESKIIAAHYDDDAQFRDHVNHYIHDFEAMMRVLLSTRDGNAIGVTLLSSDVGKLYVALAQAIERLRS